MALPNFGLTFNRSSDEPRPTIGSDLSVIGLIGPAVGADAVYYPLNTPVSIYSTNAEALTKIGTGYLRDALDGINGQLGDFEVSARVVIVRTAAGVDDDATIASIVGDEGTKTGLYAFLRAGVDLAVIPRLIGAPGYTHQHTSEPGVTNVTSGVKAGGNTGNGALTLAAPAYGASIVNGTYQVRAIGGTFAGVSAAGAGIVGNGVVTMGNPSTGAGARAGVYRATAIAAAANGGTFLVEDPDGNTVGVATVGTLFNGPVRFTIADGATDFAVGDFFNFTVTPAIPANGGTFSVTTPAGVRLADAVVGTPYTGAYVRFTIADGTTDFIVGDGFDVVASITAGAADANPICAALPSVLDRLLGHAIVEGPPAGSDSAVQIQTWRETMNSSRLIPIARTWARVLASDGSIVTRPGVGRILGLAARNDFEHGGIPSKSFANLPVQGIVGWASGTDFSLTDGDSEGQTILGYNVGIGVRGEMGVESAAGSSGFIFIGYQNAGDDALWQFYSTTRMRDYIHLGLMRTLRQRLGRTNITVRAIDVVLDDVRFWLRDLAADDRILRDFRVSFDPDLNSPEQLRLGHFRLFFQAEEAPVLTRLDIDSMRFRPALDRLLVDLLASVPPEQIAA